MLTGPVTTQATRLAQRFSRRLIPFDVGYVTSFAQRLTEDALDYLRVLPDNSPIGEHLRTGTICAADNLTLKTVTGVPTEFRVQILVGKPSQDDRYTFGHYDRARKVIAIHLPPTWTSGYLEKLPYEVINKVKSVLIHEVTHALDVLKPSLKDPEEYYKDTNEVKAFARQVVDEAERALKGLRLKSRALHKPMPQGATLVEELLAKSKTWLEIEKNLSVSGQRYIRQVLVRELAL